MTTVSVPASCPYEVHIGGGILHRLGEQLIELKKPCTVAVISDDTVFPLYGETVCRSLERVGFRTVSYVLPSGEASKNLTVYGRVLEFLAHNHLTRGDLLLALGGGMVGDLTGFAAATYLRGLPYVQVPTTLLAAVDSSVGGKTAVDLPGGKNLAGAFWQPLLVWCDTDTLLTLPNDIFSHGCAEVIKYGLLGDAAFFRRLAAVPARDNPGSVITRCVTMKRDIVARDERDTGLRQLLNLGHTFGHAIESVSQYALSHGSCVAAGMAIITRAAVEMGLCQADAAPELEALLRQYGLPINTDYPLAELTSAVLSDKKIFGQTIHLVVPEAIGRCRILETPASELEQWLRAGGVR